MWTAWRPRALVAAASMTRARLPCARAATRTPGTLGSPRASGPPIPTQSTSSAADRVSDCTAQKAIAIDATPGEQPQPPQLPPVRQRVDDLEGPEGNQIPGEEPGEHDEGRRRPPESGDPARQEDDPEQCVRGLPRRCDRGQVNSVPATRTRQSTTPVRIAIDPTEVRLNCRMASDSSIHAQPLTSRSRQYLVAPARLVAKRDPRCAASSQ